MQKIKFDFEAKKHFIYTPNSAVPIGAPVDENGNIANDGNAIGIVLGYDNVNEKYWAKQMMVVMVAGYCDIIDAQEIWGDEYSAEAMAAMSNITFCDNHELPTGGGGWPADLPKPSVGGYGYTEQGEQTVITWDGDTEGREVFAVGDPMYKVSNKIITQSDVIGGEHSFSDGTTVPITEGRVFNLASVGIENAFGISFEEGSPSLDIMCVQNDTVFVDTPISAGVYFLYGDAGYVSSLTYGTPDTIHKIDEKYLPEAGGGGNDFVIELQSNYTLNSDNLAICNQYLDFYKNGGANKPHSVTVLHGGNEYKVIGTNVYGSEGFSFEAVNFAPTVSSRLDHTDVNVIAFDCYVPVKEWTIVHDSYTLS